MEHIFSLLTLYFLHLSWPFTFFCILTYQVGLVSVCTSACCCLPQPLICKYAYPGGDVKKLDFRFFAGNKKIGAPFHGLKAFFTTGQLNMLDKVRQPASTLFVCVLTL